MGNISIEESEHSRLLAEAGRVATLESENATLKTENTELKEADARRVRTQKATDIIAARAIEHGVTFSPREVKGLLADITLTETGDLDEAKFTKLVDEDAATKKPGGQVIGFGGGTPIGESGSAITWDDIDKLDEEN